MTTFPRRPNVLQLRGAAPAVFAQMSCLVIVIGIMLASPEGSESAEFPTGVKEAGSSSPLVMQGGKLVEAPGSRSGIEGSQVPEEPPAGPLRADPKAGG